MARVKYRTPVDLTSLSITKKYCWACNDMHLLKEFSNIGFGLYGKSAICTKMITKKSAAIRKGKKEEKDFYNQFSPI